MFMNVCVVCVCKCVLFLCQNEYICVVNLCVFVFVCMYMCGESVWCVCHFCVCVCECVVC